jgi:hypothetical protein
LITKIQEHKINGTFGEEKTDYAACLRNALNILVA